MELHEHRPVSILRCLSNVRKAADQSSHLAPCRGCPDFVEVGEAGVAVSDPGHDRALGQMLVAHEPTAAMIGELVGMAAEEARNLVEHDAALPFDGVTRSLR